MTSILPFANPSLLLFFSLWVQDSVAPWTRRLFITGSRRKTNNHLDNFEFSIQKELNDKIAWFSLHLMNLATLFSHWHCTHPSTMDLLLLLTTDGLWLLMELLLLLFLTIFKRTTFLHEMKKINELGIMDWIRAAFCSVRFCGGSVLNLHRVLIKNPQSAQSDQDQSPALQRCPWSHIHIVCSKMCSLLLWGALDGSDPDPLTLFLVVEESEARWVATDPRTFMLRSTNSVLWRAADAPRRTSGV